MNKTSTTMPLSKPKVQQNKLNLKAIASRNKIKDIDINKFTVVQTLGNDPSISI